MRRSVAVCASGTFVFKTDVRSYYASIDHDLLLERLVLNLLRQYMRCCSERGGLFWEAERGICCRCPLSPIIGAFFLGELDERLEKTGLFFVRYMDDIVVLAPTRWKLRAAVKAVNEGLNDSPVTIAYRMISGKPHRDSGGPGTTSRSGRVCV